MTSKLGDVTDRVLALARELTFAYPVAVFDGPQVGSNVPKDMLLIGDDGESESDAQSTFTQAWSNLSRTRKTEVGEIPCASISWSGSLAMDIRRSQAFDALSVLESALVANPTMGDETLTVELTTGTARANQTSTGAAVVVPFTIRYSTTLGV